MNGKIVRIILHILFLAGLAFLFVGGPGHNASRSLRDLWNLGHPLLFILFIFILYSDWKGFGDKGLLKQWVLAISIGAALGLATELVQSLVGRQFDHVDIIRDLAGCATGLLLLAGSDKNMGKREKISRAAFITVIIVVLTVPLLLSLSDELIARGQFPMLSGFETPLEIDRWRADGPLSISEDIFREGKASLMAEFTTVRYSRVTMRYSLGDWGGYQYLEFSIYNPDSSSLKLVCRVHDLEHERLGNEYSDRFHRTITLDKGWNDFSIPVEEIRSAPSGRDMNLSELVQITFYSVSLPEPRTVYIDDVRLLK